MQNFEPVLGDDKAAFRSAALTWRGLSPRGLRIPTAREHSGWKILNRDYSQKVGQAELFEPQYVALYERARAALVPELSPCGFQEQPLI
jgi:hypothetical protein